jgi:hypothetical protein
MDEAIDQGLIHHTGKKITISMDQWTHMKSIAHRYENAFREMEKAVTDIES